VSVPSTAHKDELENIRLRAVGLPLPKSSADRHSFIWACCAWMVLTGQERLLCNLSQPFLHIYSTNRSV